MAILYDNDHVSISVNSLNTVVKLKWLLTEQ